MEKTFYMVYMEQGQTPTYKHESYESAKKEAIRLATTYGKPCFVLCTLNKIEHKSYTETDLRPSEDLPF